MQAAAFDIYTERLRVALESSPEVIGLVAFGSTADSNLRDEWSDHDFWVITKPGAQDSFVEDLSWLPDAHNIAITVCHGKRGRTVLYRDRHKAEFLVFDVKEAREGKVERYRILIDRDHIAELIESIRKDTLKQPRAGPEALENLCVLVWSACERYSRGELLSARQYLDGFAVNQLLSLISAPDSETAKEGKTVEDSKDALDPRRRLELRSPRLAAEVLTILNEPVPEAALRLLEIAERELKPKAPALSWEKVGMVREWISELIRNVPAG
jgi:hypothetical protein